MPGPPVGTPDDGSIVYTSISLFGPFSLTRPSQAFICYFFSCFVLFYISIPLLSELSAGGDMVSVFGQLSSTEGKTGVLSMVISWKFAQAGRGPSCFLCT
jgi:hypothetical protein